MFHAVSSYLRDTSVGTRLFLLMVCGLLAVVAVAAIFTVADFRTEAALARHDAFVRILDLSQQAETGLARMHASATAFLLRGDRDSADAYARQSARLMAVLKSLDDIPQAAPVRQAIETLRDGVAEHANQFRKIADLEDKGPAPRLARRRVAAEAAAAVLEKALLMPGREALAAQMLAVEDHARRLLAGDPQAAVDMVQARTDGFDRVLAEAKLGDAETTRLAGLMNAYFSAVLDEATAAGVQQKAAARLDAILSYLRPNMQALAGFRRQVVAAIGKTAEEYNETRTWIFLGIAGAAAAFLLIGSLITLGISRPLRGLAFAGRQLSDGNREAFIPVSTAGDEIGDLARALRTARDAAIEAEGRMWARDQRDKAALLRGQVAHNALLDEMAGGISQAVDAIAAAAAEVRQLAETADSAAAETGRHAGDIVAASNETTANLRKLATVASGLHAAIAETQNGLAAGGPADETAAGEPAAALGRLALRTRLMALNAVIGAARADNGDGGPAIEEVVAEIGTLSRRLAEESAAFAARESERAAARMPLDGLVRSVQEHGTATRDILRNAEGAVAAALSLTNAISRITRTAGDTGRVAAAIRDAADAAAQRSAKLRGDIDALLARLRQ